MLGLLGGGALNGMMDEDPRRQGLLSAALAGLAASGPSSKPVSFGQTLGQAGMQGMQAMRDAEQFGMNRDMRNMQMEQMRFQQQKMQQEMAQQAQQKQMIEQYASQLPEQDRAAFLVNPQAYMQERNKRYSVNGALVTPTGQTVYKAPEKQQLVELPVPGQPGVTQKVWLTPGETQGTSVGGMKMPEILNPQVFDAQARLAKLKKPEVSNQVTIKQEGEEAKTVGKYFGDQYADIQKAGFNAQPTINRVERLNALLENVQTGKLTPFGTEVAKTAASLGLKIDSNLGNKEAAAALANEMALQLRNPAGGAGMPGAMSDADREFLKSMTPGLSTTPEGRKMMTETTIKIAKRDQEVAKLARDYRKKNGTLDEGFYEALSAYSNANPLFTAKSKASGGAKFLGFE